jgi:membrane fusion protein, multidrug efflux system
LRRRIAYKSTGVRAAVPGVGAPRVDDVEEMMTGEYPMRPLYCTSGIRPGHWRLALVSAVAMIAALPVTAGARGFAAPAVGVVVAHKQPVYRDYSYVGQVVSPHIVNLRARITGYLEQRQFHQGSFVKKGQVLYVIEQAPYQAALDQAKADVAKAQAALVYARLALTRMQRLLHTPAGMQSTVDQDQATAESDAAALTSAQAALETAKINYGYTEIRAPISGRIGATKVNIGNVVGPNSGVLATIVSEDPMDVVFSVPVRDVVKLKASLAKRGGLAALALGIRLPDGRTDKAQGKIDFVANEVDQSTDTIQIQGSIPNPADTAADGSRAGNRELTSGESVTVLLRTRAPTDTIVLPRDAVLADQFGEYVLAVNDKNIVVRRPVELSSTTPATAAVASGLQPGERIIVDGIEKVHPGIKVDAETVKPNPAQG